MQTTHYTAEELSRPPLKECVKKTAKVNKVTDEKVIEYLTQTPTITVSMTNAQFEIDFTDNDRKSISEIVKKNNRNRPALCRGTVKRTGKPCQNKPMDINFFCHKHYS